MNKDQKQLHVVEGDGLVVWYAEEVAEYLRIQKDQVKLLPNAGLLFPLGYSKEDLPITDNTVKIYLVKEVKALAESRELMDKVHSTVKGATRKKNNDRKKKNDKRRNG